MATNKRLKQMMIDKRVTQAELAKRTELTRAAITLYVQGKSVPRERNMVKIAEVLECEIEDIFVIEDETFDITEMKNVSVNIAAKLIGFSPQKLRVGLQKKACRSGLLLRERGNILMIFRPAD